MLEGEIRLLTRPEVLKLTKIKQSTLYYYMKIGLFPRPKKIGKRCGMWLESDVQEWFRNLKS